MFYSREEKTSVGGGTELDEGNNRKRRRKRKQKRDGKTRQAASLPKRATVIVCKPHLIASLPSRMQRVKKNVRLKKKLQEIIKLKVEEFAVVGASSTSFPRV